MTAVTVLMFSTEKGKPDDRLIRDFLCEFHQIPQDSISKHLYSFRNTDAIRHVFRVAASLRKGPQPF
jgi:glutamyl-tRNA reductase